MRLSAWPWLGILAAAITIGAASEARATPTYWNLFNIEGENSLSAGFITYASQIDMLFDINRTGFYQPNGYGAGQNVVGTGSDGTTYWNLFNIEGENSALAGFITYDSQFDMLFDINRTGFYQPNFHGAAQNVVGSGSDGTTYWNLFNFEGESTSNAVYVTYDSLIDMLFDNNRTGSFIPDGYGAAQNVVGSGSDGTTYWNLFNIEGENSLSAGFITYATLIDMLNDTNRVVFAQPNGYAAGQNVVGSGATVMAMTGPGPVTTVPEPEALWLLGLGLVALSFQARHRVR